MSDKSKKPGWLRFGVKTLLMLTLASAVVFSFLRQWRQTSQIAALNGQIADLNQVIEGVQDGVAYHRALSDVYRAIDLDDPEQRRAYQAARGTCSDPEKWAASVNKRYVGDADSPVVVSVFDKRAPDTLHDYVAVLVVKSQFVDFLHIRRSRGMEWQQQNDGTTCISFIVDDLNVGGNVMPIRLQDHVFSISESGFKRVGGKPPSTFLGVPVRYR